MYASRKWRIFIKRCGEHIKNEDGGSTRGCESSGAKVRGDEDYCLIDEGL